MSAEPAPDEPVVEQSPGRAIIVTAWISNALFTATAVPTLFGVGEPVAAVTALALFAVSLPIWVVAFFAAVARTTRGDEIVVANLFFLQGSAPPAVRRQLFAALAVSLVVAAVTAWTAPFGVLVPMLALGLMGLWSARHGQFPPRKSS